MGIAYICKPNHKLALVAWDGRVTWDEWWGHLQRMLFDAEYAPMRLQITDLHHSSIGPTISVDEIQAMRDLTASQRGRLSIARVAIVAGDEWKRPKLAEVALESMAVTAVVFNALDTACVWQGVDAAEVEKDFLQIRLKLRQQP